ncbi:MAG: hypothetical protein OCC49_18460 [Fibrobacterales bacterium]
MKAFSCFKLMHISNDTNQILLISILLISTVAWSNDTQWNEEVSDNKKTVITWSITERTDSNGETGPVIEYTAVTVDSLNIRQCILTMKDVSNHKIIFEKEESKIIKTLSENKWIVYLYNDSPWPLSDFDMVNTMTFTIDSTGNQASFHLQATPTQYKMIPDVNRQKEYSVTYQFRDLKDGRVEITTRAKMVPPISVPIWMINAAFPGAEFDMIDRFIELVNQAQIEIVNAK